jgi:hypothetical protein
MPREPVRELFGMGVEQQTGCLDRIARDRHDARLLALQFALCVVIENPRRPAPRGSSVLSVDHFAPVRQPWKQKPRCRVILSDRPYPQRHVGDDCIFRIHRF